MENNLDLYIEAVLFHKAEAIKRKDLANILGVSMEEVDAGIAVLSERLQGRGVRLLKNNDSVMLGTTPETAVIIEKIIKEELDKDLGKAGLETLSIVLYQSPITRSEIDYIRGVNSSYILRNMVMRGLVERVNDQKKRNFTYVPTFELLSYLGITEISELPEYETVRKEMLGLLEMEVKEKGEEQETEELLDDVEEAEEELEKSLDEELSEEENELLREDEEGDIDEKGSSEDLYEEPKTLEEELQKEDGEE
jgi:segregation and condensation protein B